MEAGNLDDLLFARRSFKDFLYLRQKAASPRVAFFLGRPGLGQRLVEQFLLLQHLRVLIMGFGQTRSRFISPDTGIRCIGNILEGIAELALGVLKIRAL